MVNQYLRQMKPPPIAHRGSAWVWRTFWRDFTTTRPFDFTARPDLVFTTTLKNRFGKTLMTLSSEPGADGTISGDAHGWLTWSLPMAQVNLLPITKDYRNGSDVRVATWRNRGLIVFDLTCSDGVNDPWTFFHEQLVVCAPTH